MLWEMLLNKWPAECSTQTFLQPEAISSEQEVWLGVLHLGVANSCPDSTYSILAPGSQEFPSYLYLVAGWCILLNFPSLEAICATSQLLFGPHC